MLAFFLLPTPHLQPPTPYALPSTLYCTNNSQLATEVNYR
jgi:hypothetical protein